MKERSDLFRITCFGATGGIPSPSYPGFDRSKYGGNTSCYYVEAGPFKIILDNGSGVRVLGNYLMANKIFGDFIVLQSHYHWDHVQGMPFAVPYFIGANKFHIHGHRAMSMQTSAHVDSNIESVLADHQATPKFPVPFDAMPSKREYHSHSAQFPEVFSYTGETDKLNMRYIDVSMKESQWPFDSRITITTVPLNHPDGCLGYVIEYMGKRIAYCTDNEPFAYTNHRINTLCKDVDLLILDGQYTDGETTSRSQGFGHGSPRLCIEQAIHCGAKNLWISHHDPNRDDNELSVIECKNKVLYEDTDLENYVSFVKEGDTFNV